MRLRIGSDHRVEGTVRYRDRQFETAPSVTDECDSGRLPWGGAAARGPLSYSISSATVSSAASKSVPGIPPIPGELAPASR